MGFAELGLKCENFFPKPNVNCFRNMYFLSMLTFTNTVIRPFSTIELTLILVYLSVKCEVCINNLFIEINALCNCYYCLILQVVFWILGLKVPSHFLSKIMDIVGFLKSQFICHLLICYIFIVSGLIINFIQLFTLILWPINKQLFRRINCRLAYCISSRKTSFCFLKYFHILSWGNW